MPTVAELKAQAKAKATKAEPVELIEVDQEPIDETQTLELIAQIDKLPVLYSVNDNTITEARNKLALLKADSKEGYKLVVSGLSTTRKLRTSIEKQRKQMKRPALDFGSRVDTEAERLRVALEAIEEPLKAEREKWEAEEARKKQAAEEAERERIAEEQRTQREAEEAQRRVEREAEEARLKAEREAIAKEREAQRIENLRIAAEQRAERERLANIAAEQAERDRIAREERDDAQRVLNQQREALEAAKREIEEERQRIAQAEAERVRKLEAEREAAEQAERQRIEAEHAAIAKAEREAQEAAEKAERERAAAELAEAMKPDVEKIHLVGVQIRNLKVKLPAMTTEPTSKFIEAIKRQLNQLAVDCEQF